MISFDEDILPPGAYTGFFKDGCGREAPKKFFIYLIRTLWSLIFPHISLFIPMKPNFAGSKSGTPGLKSGTPGPKSGTPGPKSG